MRVVFVRHGEPDYTYVTERGFIGHGRALSQLTELGERQALAAARDVRLKGVALIVSSPYTRALQTAAIISRHLDREIKIEIDLHEWMPDLTHQFSGADAAIEAARLCAVNRGKCPADSPIRYEELRAVFDRADRCLRKYLHCDKIAVVTHGMLIRQFAFQEKIPHCGISEIEYCENFPWSDRVEKA